MFFNFMGGTMKTKKLKKIKIPCARCDKKANFPFLFCQDCVDKIIKFNKIETKKEERERIFEIMDKLEKKLNANYSKLKREIRKR